MQANVAANRNQPIKINIAAMVMLICMETKTLIRLTLLVCGERFRSILALFAAKFRTSSSM